MRCVEVSHLAGGREAFWVAKTDPGNRVYDLLIEDKTT
jgi:hypothetical protein